MESIFRRKEGLGYRLIAIVGLIVFYIVFIGQKHPIAGHDYCHFLPRMVDTYLHYRVNGFSLQWHTPSFGGGIPAFPNPQHIQFSLPQILMFLLDPWKANMTAIAVFLWVGFVFFYKFCREILHFSWQASTLGALFFCANGFYLQHMAAGHVGFQAFPMLSVLLYLLFSPKMNLKLAAALASLLVGFIIYSAGFYISIIFMLTVLVAIPLVRLISPQVFDLRRTLKIAVFGVFFGGLISMAKVVAVLSFMENFPRDVSDYFYTDYGGLFEALIGVISQLTMVLKYIGLLAAELLGGAPKNAHVDQLFVWILEVDVSLSPVLLLLLGIGIVRGVFRLRKSNAVMKDKGKLVWLVILAASFWIVFEFSTTEGWIYNTVRQLPVLRSLHYNVRNTAGFIVPLTILGVLTYEKSFGMQADLKVEAVQSGRSTRKFIGFYLSTFLFLGVYLLLSPEIQDRSCDTLPMDEAYHQAREGETFPIDKIIDGLDGETFLLNGSNRTPRDPIFGYLLEDFHILVVPGYVYNLDGQYYNFTNPQGYISGRPVELFERFTVQEQAVMDEFLQRKQPDWSYSNLQTASFWVSGVVFLAVCLGVAVEVGKNNRQ